MARVAVLIPGIMGSCLWHDDGAKGSVTLWDEDFRANYRNLVRNPTLLQWTGRRADASLLRWAYVSWLPVPKQRLWNRTIEFLKHHSEFGRPDGRLDFGYDWRQSLVHSADDLADALTDRAGASVADPPGPEHDTRFVPICHSMGGVLVRVALGLHKIHPGWIDRLFTIGSPLHGAPVAFNSLYGDLDLPFLGTLTWLLYGRNRHRFLSNLRNCLQSCASTYQLLPHIGWVYLHRYVGYPSNPLAEATIPQPFREHARVAHEAIADGAKVLEAAGTKMFTIFTGLHSARQTEYEYRIGAYGYDIEDIFLNDYGDGTVPVNSARDDVQHATALEVVSVTHHVMCNDRKVVDLLRVNL